jgi:cation diffusion facilitator family transporter
MTASHAAHERTPSRVVVLAALTANVGVALLKLVAAGLTGSSAMVAESLHSIADTANEVLLLVGGRRALRPADHLHPFGHARFSYVYAFMVSLAVFWIGGVLAVLEGVTHLNTAESVLDPAFALAILGVSAVFESASLTVTLRTTGPSRRGRRWRDVIRSTKVPELIVVFLEDVGALIGIAIAAAGVGLTAATGNPVWDAVASIAIGVLLMGIGARIFRETQSLLIGEAADEETTSKIMEAILGTDGIRGTENLRTIHVGPTNLVVDAVVLVDGEQTARAIVAAIAEAEASVRRATDFAVEIYLEPRVAEPGPVTDD